MSLNSTPAADRLHIAIFGKRNAGKSSLLNALTNQPLAIVSDVAGTTTDPVSKAMELLPLGPVLLIDTAGLDDTGTLGEMRIQKTMQVMRKTDIALLVTDASHPLDAVETALLETLRQREIPCVLVRNKCDLADSRTGAGIPVSAVTGEGIPALKQALVDAVPKEVERPLIRDLLQPLEQVVLVIPIDSAAPKGRIILPQQQVLRDVLDAHASAVVTQTTELQETLARLGRAPCLVVTDSQAFAEVAAVTPPEVPLTSFSILLARAKGNLKAIVAGAAAADSLRDGDRVLIAEGCTHHRQCEDIGTVKLPKWLGAYTGKQLRFTFTSGTDFPDALQDYAMVIHCGGCMLNAREVRYRYALAAEQGVPMTNYGILIAHLKGILQRSITPFGELL